MPAGTSGSGDLEFLATDGATWLPVMLVAQVDGAGDALPKTMRGSLSAASPDSPLAEWLEPVVQKSWIGGVGVDYLDGGAVYTRTDGYALPAGAVTATPIPGGGTATPIVAFAEFGADLWAAEAGNATTGGRVLRLHGGDALAWENSTLALGPGEILRDLCVFRNAGGPDVLVASSTNEAGSNGRLHTWNGTDPWLSSAPLAFGGHGRNRMKRVFWTTNEAVSAWRLVVISSSHSVAYSLPNLDILLASSWVEDAFVINNGAAIDELAAARQHVWVSSKVDLHDLTADGESPGLLGYEDRNPHGLSFPVLYFDGYVYRGGAGTLTRIRVDGEPTVNEIPGQCAPGWGTEMDSEFRGHVTAMTIDQGYLVVAVWNPATSHTGVFWGMDRTHFPAGSVPDGRNPLIWYGPELYSQGIRRATAMTTSMLVSGQRRLWVASLGPGNVAEIVWQSLPLAGSPIADLVSGGAHRFAPGDGSGDWNQRVSLRSMPLDWNDPTAPKYLHDVTLATRGLDAASGTKLTQWVRADPPVASLEYEHPHDCVADPATTYTPAVTTRGHFIDHRIYFTSPQGTAAAPGNVKIAILDAVRMTAWRIASSFEVRDVLIEYGDGVVNRENLVAESIDPAAITAGLVALTNSGRTTMRDPYDGMLSVKLRQVYDVEETVSNGPFGRRVTARLQLALLGPA